MSKTLAQKMFIRPGSTVCVDPPEHAATVGDLGSGVKQGRFSEADTAVLFVADAGSHADDNGQAAAATPMIERLGKDDDD